MAKFPKKFVDRVASRIKHFQNIASTQRTRDVSEADTVTVVKEILADVFGYDKYSELTSEHQIKGTFCDLAVRLDGKVRFLIEVKSAGIVLKDNHIAQALNYGANQGIEWSSSQTLSTGGFIASFLVSLFHMKKSHHLTSPL